MRVQELIEKRAKVWETAKNFVDTHEDKNGNLSAVDYKKKENKVLMSMRISAEDKELIEEKARKTGLTTSEYMRRCALGRKLPCYGDTGLLREYSMQLGKIGSNLNQIAKHLNGGGDFCSVYYEVKEAIRELLDLKFKILPALEDVACGKKRRRKIDKDGEA